MKETKTEVPQHIQTGEGEKLFDFVADQVQQFLVDNRLDNEEPLPLGFTFSFPCIQKGLAVAHLDHWTKGFSSANVEGRDVGKMLSEALSRKGVKAKVVAVLNDTTGCLMACHWKEPSARIGLIIGTGTNACYIEEARNVELAEEVSDGLMVVNTEWGAFGEHGELDFLLTKWDLELDSRTVNPGRQVLEKMVSGMYLGELVRLILLDLQQQGLVLVQGVEEGALVTERGSFETKHLCEVESDPVGEFGRTRAVWISLGVTQPTREDCSVLRSVCEAVSRRTCFLLAAGLSALLKKMDDKDVTVAVDGSLFKNHPHFRRNIEYRMQQLMGVEFGFRMVMSQDGSGRGAALVAATLANEVNGEEKKGVV